MNLRLMTRRLLLLLATLALGACTQSYTVFSDKYFVSFSCDMSAVPFNSLHTLGHFLAVRPKTTKDGYRVKSPDGTERDYPYTEVQSRVFSFGLAGLIIGQPYFEEGIYAFDLGCPECDRSSARLTVDLQGMATCSRCQSVYNLNNGGMPQSGTSKPLYRYRTTRNGNTLMVHN